MYLSPSGSSSTTSTGVAPEPGLLGWPEVGAGSVAAGSATGIVNVILISWSGPPLSAHVRPPCASTSPLHMTSPKPAPWLPIPSESDAASGYFLNRRACPSGGKPLLLSETYTATSTPSLAAETWMREISAEFL